MRMRILILALVLVLLPGCAWFRSMFDETPEQAKARQARQEAQQREEATRRKPVIPQLFPKKKDQKPELLQGSELSPAERQLIQNSWNEPDSYGDTQSYRDQMQKQSQKNSDYVFGTGLFE